MLSAAARVVGELGYGGMSVARVTGGAGVSRRTFYDLFDDREDCFLELFDEAVARAAALACEAVVGLVGWRERVRAGLSALLVFIDNEPRLGSLLVVDALVAGPRVLERRAQQLDVLKSIVDEGRHSGSGEARTGTTGPLTDPGRSVLTAEGVVGAVLSVIHARLLEQGTGIPPSNGSSQSRARRAPGRPLVGLLNQLMGMIVLPYLGRAAAARELARPAPRIPRRASTTTTGASRDEPARDPLQGLDMRLTYRTLLVLSAIAARPGASNRQIAEHAGVHDQGQISKLLGRLDRLGLITNTGQGHVKGEPNAWSLTPKGREVEQATRVHASFSPAPGEFA